MTSISKNPFKTFLILLGVGSLTALAANAGSTKPPTQWPPVKVEPSEPLQNVAREMATAAQELLEALDERQRSRAHFELNDAERSIWHYVPVGINHSRRGVTLRSLNIGQRLLVSKLLETALSEKGTELVENIRKLDDQLKSDGGILNLFLTYDALSYNVSVFGSPKDPTWGWRFEGHHVSLHFTVFEGQLISHLPNFFGSNPVALRTPRKEVLNDYRKHALRWISELSAEEQKKAVFSTRTPQEILFGPGKRFEDLKDEEGILVSELNRNAQEDLQELITRYIETFKRPIAEDQVQRIQNEWSAVRFVWMGPIDSGKPNYFRVQGPSFVWEFDNAMGTANHIHSSFRSRIGGDFGENVIDGHRRSQKH